VSLDGVLRSGKRLFGDGTDVPLSLRKTEAFGSDGVLLSYEPARAT
jgi:hypothetical protein